MAGTRGACKINDHNSVVSVGELPLLAQVAVRDQLPLVKNIKAAVFFAHGLNDWNVVPEHTIRMWNEVKKFSP